MLGWPTEGTWLGCAGPAERVVLALAQPDLWGPGDRGQRAEPRRVARPKVAQLWHWQARAQEAQSLARGWPCSRARMSRSAFSR